MTLQELREKINKYAVDMTAILTKAKGENRELTAEEATQFDAMDADREALLATERREAKVVSFEQGQGRRSEPTQPGSETRGTPAAQQTGRPSGLVEAEAIRAWMLGGSDVRTAAHAEAARRCGLSLDQKQIVIRLAARRPESLRREDLREWEQRDLTAGTVSPDNGGHYTTQIEMLRALEVASLAYGGIYQVATVDRTDSGSDMPIPTMNDTSNEGVLIGEAVQETNELDPTLNQLVLQAYTYSSKKVFMSLEYIQDNAINAVGRIGTILGERIARVRNRHFTVGTGNSQPNGIVTAATSSGVTSATATTFSYDNIVDLEHSVDPSYRSNAKFMFHDNSLKVLKKIKVPQFDGDTAGYPLWRAGMTASDPDTINGYPYVINQHMPLPTTGQKAMIFGDLSKYRVREVRDITIVRLDELYAEYRQVVFLAWARFDGDLLDAGTHPVKYMTQA
jgi:HK97 family phage major capsid protein